MTIFNLNQTIDSLTKNTQFVGKLIKEKKAEIIDGKIEYILQDSDFPESVLNNLNYIKEELGLTNDNWGYLRYDDTYEQTGSYCFRVFVHEGQLVFRIGSSQGDEFEFCTIPFEPTIKDSKLHKNGKKATYKLSGKEVKVLPNFKEGKPGVFTITVSLDEIDLELPFYVDKDVVVSEVKFWELWDSGNAHLVGQLPTQYKKLAKAGEFLQKCILENNFPENGVSVLVANPNVKELTKRDGSGTFNIVEFDVIGFSHEDIKCIQTYNNKNGITVTNIFDTKDIGKLSFSPTHTAAKEWLQSGYKNVLMIVWFKSLNKIKTYIPNHVGYLLTGEMSDIPIGYINKFEEFLQTFDEQIAEFVSKIDTENKNTMLQLMAAQNENPITEVKAEVSENELDTELAFA